MFNEKNENYVLKHPELVEKYKKIQATNCGDCLSANSTVETISETFKFIKAKEYSLGNTRDIVITMGVSLKDSQNSVENKYMFAVTSIYGIITKVYDTYAELSYINDNGQLIKQLCLMMG